MNKTTSEEGRAVNDFVKQGLEVNAEIALEEPQCPQGVDEEVLAVIKKHGLKSVLAAIQSAAWGASEVHDEDSFCDGTIDMGPFRTRIFAMRISDAMDCLK